MTKTTPLMKMTRRYGHTVYTISAYGNPDSAHTYEDRLLNLIQHEAEKADGSGKLHQAAAQAQSTITIAK